MTRIRVINDPALEQLLPGKCPHRVSVRLTDGRELSSLSEYSPGWLTRALSRRE